MIVLPTISHSQTLKGGVWKEMKIKENSAKKLIMVGHESKYGSSFSITCQAEANIVQLGWVVAQVNLKLLPKPLGHAKIIIDEKPVATLNSFRRIKYSDKTYVLFSKLDSSENLQLFEKFKTAQRTIGIIFPNGVKFTVNAKGSTKIATRFIPCINAAKKNR